jgi:hypothetical protein
VTLDFHTYENLVKASSHLIDLDEKTYKGLTQLQDFAFNLERFQKKIKSFRFDFDLMKKTVVREFQRFTLSMRENCEIGENDDVRSLREKLRTILNSLVYPETIDLFLYQKQSNVPVRLQTRFYKDLTSEEPELELNSRNENKRLINHVTYLTHSLEQVTEELLKILNDLPSPSRFAFKSPEETKYNTSLTPHELKSLMQKISKLHSRGSLTDEEARNMIGKISEIPISPQHESPDLTIKKEDLSVEIFSEETPILTLMEKSKTPTNSSLSKDLQKRATLFRKITRRVQTPSKKISRNTSLPRASALVKFNTRDKSKLKLKSKSPHSFLYI